MTVLKCRSAPRLLPFPGLMINPENVMCCRFDYARTINTVCREYVLARLSSFVRHNHLEGFKPLSGVSQAAEGAVVNVSLPAESANKASVVHGIVRVLAAF